MITEPDLGPDIPLIEKTLGAPLDVEMRRAVEVVWPVLLPQINLLIDRAAAAGKQELKARIGEWMVREIENYRKKSTSFSKLKELRELRKVTFRAEALEQILKEIENF